MNKTRQQTGFVLVNALVLVAAMSAAAVVLLARAEDGRARLVAANTAEALRSNLDAFDALSLSVLQQDQSNGRIDSLSDSWAKPLPQTALDQGTVSGTITDEQGKFNVNWLTNPDDQLARDAFDNIMAGLGLPLSMADAIEAFVSNQGPKNRASFQTLETPTSPLSGPILLLDQIRTIPEVSQDAFARLHPFVSALPGGTQLNVNTASERVLGAMLPQLTTGQMAALLRRRSTTPFETLEILVDELDIDTVDEQNPDAVDPGRFSVSSEWFAVQSRARVHGREAGRHFMIRRDNDRATVAIEWRITQFGEH